MALRFKSRAEEKGCKICTFYAGLWMLFSQSELSPEAHVPARALRLKKKQGGSGVLEFDPEDQLIILIGEQYHTQCQIYGISDFS